jgi:hypothetical protein
MLRSGLAMITSSCQKILSYSGRTVTTDPVKATTATGNQRNVSAMLRAPFS